MIIVEKVVIHAWCVDLPWNKNAYRRLGHVGQAQISEAAAQSHPDCDEVIDYLDEVIFPALGIEIFDIQ